MIKITDIARMAGVSKATVSRAINNSGYVSPETKKRIMHIVNKYNYVQYAAAVALSTKDSKLIAVMIPEIDNVFYGEVLKGITESADKLGYTCMLYDTRNSLESEKKVINAIKSQRVRGILLGPSVDYDLTEEGKKTIKEINSIGVPVVVLDRYFDSMEWDAVIFDNYKCSYDCALELHKKGCSHLAVISGDMQLKIGRDRLNGFLDGAKVCKLNVEEDDIYYGDFLIPKAYQLSKKMLNKDILPDAVFLSNNRTALGFLQAANELGVEIGKDIEIIGIDYIPSIESVGIRYSTVDRDNYEIGRKSIELLQNRMNMPDVPQVISVAPAVYRIVASDKSHKKE